jgi:adenylyltransferase/sulfurtransferase
VKELALEGVVCPLNWVRTRLVLESMGAGERLLVRLDPGEAIESVPRLAREQGHDVEVNGTAVTIVKGGAPAAGKVRLSDAELERYSRQLVLPQWSGAAQERLKDASAIVIGAGALGSPAATYLVAAGVGRVGIVDDEAVELSNLHRQPLHFSSDLGASKAESAAAKLGLLNPEVVVEPYPARLDALNAEAIVAGADVVVDCSDSFETRYFANDACCAQGVPLVEGAVLGFAGLVLSIRPGESACYRCVFPVPPPADSVPSCREAGVLGAAAGVVGSIQALEALKLLSGTAEPLTDRLLQLDLLGMSQTLVATRRRDDCLACAREAPAPQSP